MTRRYLLGTRLEKEKIERLLIKRQPGVTYYEFAYLCDTLLERLIEGSARNLFDFDFHLSEFLDDFETDVRETNSLHHADLRGYLADVGEAMIYFCRYLEQLDFFPAPITTKVMEGSVNTVLLVEVFDPRQPRPTFSTKRNL